MEVATTAALHCRLPWRHRSTNHHVNPTHKPISLLCRSTSARTNPSPPPGLVLDVGTPGSWDAGGVGSPVIKRFLSDNGDRWLMWYHGHPSPQSTDPQATYIGLATSPDGIHWERDPESPVLQRGTDWWVFDNAGVRPSAVLVMSSDVVRVPTSVYWLYYTGTSTGGISLPGLAISQDGRHWARIEGGHHSGALFDAEEWESSSVSSPCVVHHSRGDLRMYYHAVDRESGKPAIGMARSRDGIEWTKLGKVEMEGGGEVGAFDEMGARSPHVVQDTGGYVMAYEGVARDGGRSVGLARSSDGLKGWRVVGGVLAEGRSPCLVEMDGGEAWRLYYEGAEGGGIGLAVGDVRGSGGFRRWEELLRS